MNQPMTAGQATTGETYLSVNSRIPVTIIGPSASLGRVKAKVESTGTEIDLEPSVQLDPFDATRIPASVITTMRAYNPGRAREILGEAPAPTRAPVSKPEPTKPPTPPKTRKAPESKPQTPSKPAKTRKAKKPSLAPIIDALLRAGTKTTSEIASQTESDAAAAGIDTTGKDLKANVRARLAHYKKKGTPVTKDADGRLKLDENKGKS